MSAADNSRIVRVCFDFSRYHLRLRQLDVPLASLFLLLLFFMHHLLLRRPSELARGNSVTSVEKVERGIRPGRCADVTLGRRAETGRQVVVGHTHTHTHTYTRTHTVARLGRLLHLASGSFLSLFLLFPLSLNARTRGD